MSSILVFNKYYVPAYKAGGPIRSLENIVSHLGDDYKFKIITRDRDYEDGRCFSGINVDEWNQVGKAKVFYCSPSNQNIFQIWRTVKNVKYDAIYVNSIFEPWFGIQPQLIWRFSLLRDVPFILAPRGEFSPGAIRMKTWKKKAYLSFFKALSMHRLVTWHASTDQEARQIREWMGNDVKVKVARNVPSIMKVENKKKQGSPEGLDVVFLSRVNPKKNVHYALRVLEGIDINVNFNIYGIVDDKKYWRKCVSMIKRLPENINVEYRGDVPHEEVGRVFSSHDLFFFPTRGENYGHVIFEALSSGCPVLISDETPWSSVQEEEAGWIVSLDDPRVFRNVIRTCAEAEEEKRDHWRNQAKKLATDILNDSETVERNRELFEEVL